MNTPMVQRICLWSIIECVLPNDKIARVVDVVHTSAVLTAKQSNCNVLDIDNVAGWVVGLLLI